MPSFQALEPCLVSGWRCVCERQRVRLVHASAAYMRPSKSAMTAIWALGSVERAVVMIGWILFMYGSLPVLSGWLR